MKISIPTNINDITLEQFQKYSLVNVEGADSEFLMHKTIEIFCDVDLKTVSKFPIKDAKEIVTDIHAVLDQEQPFTDRFEMNGVTYGFLPVLEDMSLGEYIDLEEGLKDTKDFHKAASVMFRPVTKEFKELYSIEGYEVSLDRQRLMKQAPVGIISAAIVFFYHIGNELLRDSQSYSKNLQEMIETTLEKGSSLRSMDGSAAYTHFLGVMRQNMERLLNLTT